MNKEKEKLLHQIQQLSERIYKLNDKTDLTMITPSEIRKIEKARNKLIKKKDKLSKKLYEEVNNESNIYN